MDNIARDLLYYLIYWGIPTVIFLIIPMGIIRRGWNLVDEAEHEGRPKDAALWGKVAAHCILGAAIVALFILVPAILETYEKVFFDIAGPPPRIF